MAMDERNFRSSYYEKVGCNSVEEQKSLNMLLKDQIAIRSKLQQFCLSFIVPTSQRSLAWNIILGVLPVHQNAREYVMEQRRAVYDDVYRAVTTLRYVDDKTPKWKILYTMWLLENKQLHLDININEDNQFVKITKVVLQVFDNEREKVEIYWIAKEFYELTKSIETDNLKEMTKTTLQGVDTVLYDHLDKHQFFNSELIDEWYRTCFAGIINEAALVRVWDKICGGSRKILVYIMLELLKTKKFRNALLQCKNLAAIRRVIENARDYDASSVLKNAITSWDLARKSTSKLLSTEN